MTANFHDSYLKIGHPFNNFGWPENYESHRDPILTVDQIRSSKSVLSPNHVIVGGHTYNGLHSFIPGSWHIWTNYRDPIQRLNSGILRFYSKKLKISSKRKGHLVDREQFLNNLSFTNPSSVDLLLETVLLRESNGITRRLAALSTKGCFSFNLADNIETVDLISTSRYDDVELFRNALLNLIQSQFYLIQTIFTNQFFVLNPFIN